MADGRWLWSSTTVLAKGARMSLFPFACAFRAGTVLRNAAYDAGILPSYSLPAPSISIGNLSVGGTGKTPVAHWIADRLAGARARPAILLRGYGADEGDVHRILSPGRIVVENPDRVRGAHTAVLEGADVLVLDDAFQHRRVLRTSDVVVLSADATDASPWPLPAGPWREGMASLDRADLVLVTRKAASLEEAAELTEVVRRRFPDLPVAIAHLVPGDMIRAGSTETQSLAESAGRSVVAVSGIGNPHAFEAQLRAAGMTVQGVRFPDHHRFTADDARRIAREAQRPDVVICTLKDAVKLGPLWQRAWPPLWYLSQRMSLDRGEESVAELLAAVLAARPTSAPPPNP